jgi:hypothetical protein
LVVQHNDAFRILDRKGAQQNSANYAEDGGICTDAERERK